ncbi:hypothetical protein E2C01_046546 [Portunus trituberculatus]|uniref:Dscam n=1 Tax=Portunus trituberculatus TaxID=210409 RepID=A0A5B7FY70_PORTR|nr:hypothetical protein [Portunus trituberculatus]
MEYLGTHWPKPSSRQDQFGYRVFSYGAAISAPIGHDSRGLSTIAPIREVPAYGAGDLPFYLNLNLIVPVVSAVVVIVLAIVIICYLRGRNAPIKATLPPSVPDSHVSWLPDWWPKWLDLNVLVPVIATIVVIIVGIVVVCVAVTRRKNGIENLRLRGETKAIMQMHLQGPCPQIPLPRILLPLPQTLS